MAPSLLLLLLLLLFFFQLSTAQKKYLSSFSISDSPWLPSRNLTLLSPNRIFAAGFLPSPPLLLFSVWVRAASDRTVVWSLDPHNPVSLTTPLSISPQGHLTLPSPSSGRNLFPPSAAANPNTTSLRLTDDGDLVFGNWTSFSSPPTDTLLPTQTIPANGTTLLSGRYRLVNASALVFGHGSSAVTYWSTDTIQSFNSTGAVLKVAGDTFLTDDVGANAVRRLTLDPDGNLRAYSLVPTTRRWKVVWSAVQELCTISGTCGLNAICVPNGAAATSCACPPGYRKVGSSGSDCELKRPYAPNSKFLRLDFVDFPGDTDTTEDISPANFELCRSSCLANSSCAWFSYKFDGTRPCNLHFGSLLYGRWSLGSELSSFLRVSSSESDVSDFSAMTAMIDTTCPAKISLAVPPNRSKVTARNIAIISTLFALELLAGVLSFWAFLRKYSKYRDMAQVFWLEFLPPGGPKRFSYSELKSATNDFSNVVGRGGFGVVYKGELSDGRVVAVKLLKNGAGGREAEFWAEVTIIGRMHHLNLVRMWGFCTEKEQRMLVYEYIGNGSLDKFLFEKQATAATDQVDCDGKGKKVVPVPPRSMLDWDVRYRIALGVARAIAYLHEECFEWVLHCDIKPENILIEDDFCPKVSDFGLSKLTDSKDMVTMSRIRGTRGYMAPEWVKQRDPITAKADVYSFGVVLLEIVTGVRNSEVQSGGRMESEDWYFPRWAFEKVYVEKRLEDILDRRIMESYDNREHLAMVERVVKTAMWCLQDRAEARPSMGKVAKMLDGTLELTDPPKPSIFYLDDEI